ncbi:MAG: nucleoside hydrolase [Candidatus Hydrogenedentes bacterium]|nr:nucleoside hydrolase [Candidatus Hydrogenedentota bacterium]
MRNTYVLLIILLCVGGAANGGVPILYTTDLLHPHADPDDHFDIATLFGMPELDIQGVVFDLGPMGKDRPGIVALRQMMHLTGKEVPYATGLIECLKSPEDTGKEQPKEAQAGIELILRTLEESSKPVTVFTTGSLRDVAAALNRNESLCREKIARIYINAGHSGGEKEYNVEIDPHAYVRVMHSYLPIYLVPCFGIDGYQSLWQFTHKEVLEEASSELQRFFVYALTKADPKMHDPIKALSEPIPDDVQRTIWEQERRMWCTGAFLHAAGRPCETCSFRDAGILVEPSGRTTVGPVELGQPMKVFHVDKPDAYRAEMLATLKQALEALGG